MRIDILCSDGSPLGVSVNDIWGKGRRGIGVGGSEYALLTMCEQWQKDGHQVTLYNNPLDATENPFPQRSLDEFNFEDSPDVLIVFRSPNQRAISSRAKLKVWWSCDQFTVGSFKKFAPFMDKIVTISPYHAEYFRRTYGIINTVTIDLPVRFWDFDKISEVEKIPGRMIFTSVPDRGLQHLWTMWPVIKRDIPNASLVITSDYRLWGLPDARNQRHRLDWMRYEGVMFVGAIPRQQLLIEQAKAEFLLYPSLYDTAELFCVSVAEAQSLGVYPITSSWGALETTNMGSIISGRADTEQFRNMFIDELKRLCVNPIVLSDEIHTIKNKSLKRFHPEKIAKQWEEWVFK